MRSNSVSPSEIFRIARFSIKAPFSITWSGSANVRICSSIVYTQNLRVGAGDQLNRFTFRNPRKTNHMIQFTSKVIVSHVWHRGVRANPDCDIMLQRLLESAQHMLNRSCSRCRTRYPTPSSGCEAAGQSDSRLAE